MNDLEQEILNQEIASRKQKNTTSKKKSEGKKSSKTSSPKVPKEKVKKEKVFKLKKDHIICPSCNGMGTELEITRTICPVDSDIATIPCSSCEGKGQYKPRKAKQVKSESELVHEYANRVMDGKAARGHADDRFAYTQKENQTNKQLWMDQDFFCHLAFQSAAQKYDFMAFLEKNFNFEFDEVPGHQIQIANGFRLGKLMGCDLKEEKAAPYPYANLDLLPLVLDEEAL